jgi:ubiquinone biosynthesis protein UbiJ
MPHQHVVSTDSFFDLANLYPRHTGLPFVVWISMQGNARHDVRVKVSLSPKAQPGEMISVALRPEARVIDGDLSAEQLQLLTQWIELNREVLLQYWTGDIDTVDAVSRIRKIGGGEAI